MSFSNQSTQAIRQLFPGTAGVADPVGPLANSPASLTVPDTPLEFLLFPVSVF
jgi:hypothetical protein